MKITVEISNIRTDLYLAAQNREVSRKQIQRAIQSGLVLVNNKRVKPSFVLEEGMVITAKDVAWEAEKPLEYNPIALDLLYEDQHILLINKPVGVVVHPSPFCYETTLSDAILSYCPSIRKIGESSRPGIVHRLDKNTEGVMIVAKSLLAYQSLVAQFKERRVKKSYYAVVSGVVKRDYMHIDRPIGKMKSDPRKFEVSQNGKPAQSELTVVKRYTNKTLLTVGLMTGRTHQIRVHLSAIGHPIMGDPVYGKAKPRAIQKLQAYRLSFFHPKTGHCMTFSLPLSPSLLVL